MHGSPVLWLQHRLVQLPSSVALDYSPGQRGAPATLASPVCLQASCSAGPEQQDLIIAMDCGTCQKLNVLA